MSLSQRLFKRARTIHHQLRQDLARPSAHARHHSGLYLDPLEPRVLLSRVIYVDDSAPAGGDGTAWNLAYRDLQQALSTAASGDQIQVAQGTYKPTSSTSRAAAFNLKSGVAMYGGYAGYGSADPNARDVALYPSILSGDIGTPGNNADNSYHVIYNNRVDATAVLDGFTITAGNANGFGIAHDGGGMHNFFSSPTVNNCTFSDNSAVWAGGGIYNSSSSSPILTNCTFNGNSASGSGDSGGIGGGMYNSPSSSVALSNCTFTSNTALYGGGVYNDGSAPTLSNCTFRRNSASKWGGGMNNYSYSSPVLSNCTFSGNSAAQGGGMANGYSSPKLVNCILAGNLAYALGGGIYDINASSPTVTNCIFWGNAATSDPQIYQSDGPLNVTYSDIQGGWTGTGNIDADPLFVRNPSAGADGKWGTADDDYGDLRLQLTSPAIDAGDNASVPAGITTDLAGNSRFQDVLSVPDTGSGTAPFVDMGAYENQGGRDNLILAGDELVTLTADQHLASLSISGNARLNLKDHDLLIDSADLMQVRSWIQSGVLFSDATIPGKSVALGYAFSGNGVLVKYTYRGDADLDGDVDGDDVAKWAVNFTGSLTNPSNPKLWTQGDWDYDGDVDGDDVAKWAVNFTGALTSGGLSESEPQPALVSSPVAHPQVGPAPVSQISTPAQPAPVSVAQDAVIQPGPMAVPTPELALAKAPTSIGHDLLGRFSDRRLISGEEAWLSA